MKIMKGLISILLPLLLFACATTEKTVTDESMVSGEEKTIEDSSDKKLVEVEVETIEYFITKETSYYGDGQIDTITKYTYNDDFVLLTKVQVNEQDEILESYINEIKNGVVVKQGSYGFGNILNTYTVYVYDNDGKFIEESLFDNEDKLQSTSLYEYTGENVTTWKTLGSNGGTLALTTYEYDKNGNNTKVEMKNASGVVDGIIEKTYSKNLLVEEKILDSKGKVEKSASYIYENDQLVEKIYMDSKNKIKRSESYDFDNSLPVPDKINLHYKSGALEAYTLVEYEMKTTIQTMWVEE